MNSNYEKLQKAYGRPRLLHLKNIVVIAMLGLGLATQSGCKPLIQALRNMVKGSADDVAGGVRGWFRKAPPVLRKAAGSDQAKAAAARAGVATTRLVITQLAQAFEEARNETQRAKEAINKLPPGFPYRAMQVLKALQERNETSLRTLHSEIEKASQSGDLVLTDSDAAFAKEAFERIAREQAAVARLAEKVG